MRKSVLRELVRFFVIAVSLAVSVESLTTSAMAVSQTRQGSSSLSNRTAEACLLEARKNAIVDALMNVATKELRYDATAVKPKVEPLAADRAVVRRFSSRQQKVEGDSCSIVVRVAIDEQELNRRIKGDVVFKAACIPEIGVVMKALYQPLNGKKEDASRHGFGMAEATQAMEQALLSHGVKMTSLDPLLYRFINNETSAYTTLDGTGRQKSNEADTAVELRGNVETYLKDNPKLRRPGFVVVTARIDLGEHGKNNYGETEVETSASMKAVVVSQNRSSDFRSMFRVVGAVATPPGIHAGPSYAVTAREAMILATEGAARTIASQFLKDIQASAASSRFYQLVLTNVTSERKQVRKVVDAFHNVGMCNIERVEGQGDRRVYRAGMPAEDADRIVNVALDLLEKQPQFRGIDYTLNNQTYTIKLP